MKTKRTSLNIRKSVSKILPLEFNEDSNISIRDKLFYYFLRHDESIPEFESSKKVLMQSILQEKKNNFYSAYLKMEKIYTWKGFKLSYINFKLLYLKSRIFRKNIIKFAIENKKPISEVFESYSPKYYNNSKIHNWEINPKISYLKYQYKKLKEKNQNENQENKLNNLYDTLSKSNIYVLTKTKGKQNLIFSGKLCNVFCQDPIYIENKPDSFFLNKKKDYIYRIRNNSLLSPNDLNDSSKKESSRKKKNFSNLNSTNFPTLSISKINENPSPIISSRPKTLKLYTKTISLSTNKSLKKSKIMKNGNLKRYFLNKNDFIYY
jgi:hypothetical protein